ncbi:MAG: hypothetical protein U0984_05530 [Prosthecobacter sp.]|nr:hypothetical protein [Prosthecobacter sp.]
MALLLLAAAVVFFWLGWRWRGQKAAAQALALNASVDAESHAAERARHEKEAAQAALLQQIATSNREAAELLEAREHQRHREREILRLAEELRAAKRQTEESEARVIGGASGMTPAPLPPPPAKAVPAPVAKKPAPSPAAPPAVPATKPARPKKPLHADKSPATPVDPQVILATLEAKEHSQQVLVGALNQEREGWQHQVSSLNAKAASDPAGFALASKNLARSESQHAEAMAALKSLHRQASALQRSLAAGAPAAEDDLTQIKGIKAALDQQLRAFGIRTYRQIAQMSADDLQAFSELLAFKNRAHRDEWQRQARELHRAKYGEDAG